MACCRYLSITFRLDFPPVEANAKLPEVEMLADHLSRRPLLVYALVNFQTHLDHLGSNNEKVRDEFMNFVKLLIKQSNSYASLLLGQWIEALKWPTKLHVDDTLARLLLHSLLSCAIETRQKVAEVLLSLRSDLLHIVAGKGYLVTEEWTLFTGATVKLGLLLNLGANIDLKDTDGRTLLSYAARNGHEDILMHLLEKGANPNSNDTGRTSLSYAAENGHDNSLMLLVEKGANLNSNDTEGRTPLSYAAENGREDSLKLLLKNGANANLKDIAGWTPLSYAAENGHEDSVTWLFQFSANVNLKDTAGQTPLYYAAKNGHEGSLKLILLYGGDIDVNLKDTASQMLISYAAENGHEGSLKLLLENGASLDSNDTSWTLLSYAATNGHIAVVKLLQSHITA
ncbi:hypothetical protein VE00_03065 [Pseudogymnoascus sp. WSF 3629]|nr:hypothetical protein VE00_03065 [Pseudogymnoascus sp. WSF 3629]